jgi:hypothetical protein
LKIKNLYNGGFIAHNILITASQDMDTHRCIEISYITDCEAVWHLFYIETNVGIEQLASLALPICVPAGFLYFLWTYGFASAAVEA